jgi:hypothetical protein
MHNLTAAILEISVFILEIIITSAHWIKNILIILHAKLVNIRDKPTDWIAGHIDTARDETFDNVLESITVYFLITICIIFSFIALLLLFIMSDIFLLGVMIFVKLEFYSCKIKSAISHSLATSN